MCGAPGWGGRECRRLLLLRGSPGLTAELHAVLEAADVEVLSLGVAHDELFVAGEDGHLAEVHRVHGVEEAGEAVLGRVHEVVVEREEEDGLEDLDEGVARADGHGFHDSTSTRAAI